MTPEQQAAAMIALFVLGGVVLALMGAVSWLLVFAEQSARDGKRLRARLDEIEKHVRTLQVDAGIVADVDTWRRDRIRNGG